MKKKLSDRLAPMSMEAFQGRLKELGLKATPQRSAVHEAMISLIHANADMVAEHISARSETRVTVASVYNILSGMSELGIYSRRMSPENKMWFDVNAFRHLHAYDAAEGTFIDIMDDELAKLFEDRLKRVRIKGYKFERADVQIICRPVKKKRKNGQ